MSTLTSESTLAQIDTEIAANLHYLPNNSVSEAQDLVTACFWWRTKRPASTAKGSSSTAFDAAFIDKIMSDAQAWIVASDSVDNPQVIALAVGPR